jgi:hypothetical protein
MNNSVIDMIERFQTQHALQEEREMKPRHDLGDKVEILSRRNPTEPLVANLSGSLGEGAELKARLKRRSNNKFHHALTNQTKEN